MNEHAGRAIKNALDASSNSIKIFILKERYLYKNHIYTRDLFTYSPDLYICGQSFMQ